MINSSLRGLAFGMCFILFFSCVKNKEKTTDNDSKYLVNKKQYSADSLKLKQPDYVVVLGTAQDAGFPQINCKKECCIAFYDGKEAKKHITALGLVSHKTKRKWLFEATPDITVQLENLEQQSFIGDKIVDGVFLTHAHIGHYTGLMQFGREAMGASAIVTYTMPKMKQFLEQNGPWNQLVILENIKLKALQNDSTIQLSTALKVTPILVPHRDEFSETVGYKIEGDTKSMLFIPDINKWELWEKNIVEEVKKVDYALLDATFFKEGEINRPMSEVPHPFVTETVKLFEKESEQIKNKIYFIHFNHTNPALKKQHRLKDSVQGLGFNFAYEGLKIEL